MSLGLKLHNKFISFPYINPNKNATPANRLLVNIEEESKSISDLTSSLKFAYHEYYPQYDEYLRQNKMDILYYEICNYINTIIQTPLKYQYRAGQFGYLKTQNPDVNRNNLQQSFVMITNISELKREIFFLHQDTYQYEYTHYDITSPIPKLLKDKTASNTSNWMRQSEFIPVETCITTPIKSISLMGKVTTLLNWKCCREDYLTKKLDERRLQMLDLETCDDLETCYETTATENDYSDPSYGSDSDSRCNSIVSVPNYKPLPTILEENGYTKDKDFTQTLKGEIIIAINRNKFGPVAIKKLYNQNITISDEKMHLVKEALLLRNLKTENSWVRASIVNYIDFFQSSSDFYVVMELNFSVTLKEFVQQSHIYIKKKQLSLKEYQNTIKYLLWSLGSTLHWLHTDTDMKCSDLDICAENIMLTRPDFKRGSNGVFEINLEIEMKLIDIGSRELVEIGANEKLKQFEYMYNEKYLLQGNQQYLVPNNNILLDPQSYDIWAYGMVTYFCFIGDYPYKQIPTDNVSSHSNDVGYDAICNGQLKQHLGMTNCLKYMNRKIVSLLNGVLNVDPSKQFNINDVIQHKWFNSFYKTYKSLLSHK